MNESTVAKYMRRHPRPPSQTWRTFLTNHASQIRAADLFVVPTVTFRLLFVLVILPHDRRQIVHMAVHRASDSGPDGTTTSHRVSVRRTLLFAVRCADVRIPEGIVCGPQRGITRGCRGGVKRSALSSYLLFDSHSTDPLRAESRVTPRSFTTRRLRGLAAEEIVW